MKLLICLIFIISYSLFAQKELPSWLQNEDTFLYCKEAVSGATHSYHGTNGYLFEFTDYNKKNKTLDINSYYIGFEEKLRDLGTDRMKISIDKSRCVLSFNQTPNTQNFDFEIQLSFDNDHYVTLIEVDGKDGERIDVKSGSQALIECIPKGKKGFDFIASFLNKCN